MFQIKCRWIFQLNTKTNEKYGDYYIDPKGVKFSFNADWTRTDYYGYERHLKEYVAETLDEDGDVIDEALTKKGYPRKTNINPELERYKAKQRELLSDEKNKEVYGIRKVDVEPAFGFLKTNLGFTRFNVRGIDKVENEMGLALMACNMRKIALAFNEKQKTQIFSFLWNEILGHLFTFLTTSIRMGDNEE